MRVLGPIVQIPMLPMRNTGHNDASRGGVAAQLVRDNHPRAAPGYRQQLAEETDRGEAIAFWLDKYIEHNPVLIVSLRRGPPSVFFPVMFSCE